MSINVFTFSGNLGKDMEVRYTPNGKSIGEVSVACKSGYGEHEKTSWIRCKLFGDRAVKLSEYLTKGSAVTITGEFQLDEWERDGVKHSIPCVIIRDIQLPPRSDKQPSQQPSQPQQAPSGFMVHANRLVPAKDEEDIPF